jgi:Icc-related predicted phosphoesterase
LLNFIDYRTYEGLLADVAGKDMVAETVKLRAAGDYTAASERWRAFAAGRESELRRRFDELIAGSYRAAATALEAASEAYVTYGNVDRPDLLAASLPPQARFVDAEVVTIDGLRVGFAGGGAATPLRTAGEVSEEDMASKLDTLGPVDMLCTHVAPAVRPLSTDVVGGRVKQSGAVLDYLHRYQPSFHYFGDVHQPQAVSWRVGRTRCMNVGYFRATCRAVRHG